MCYIPKVLVSYVNPFQMLIYHTVFQGSSFFYNSVFCCCVGFTVAAFAVSAPFSSPVCVSCGKSSDTDCFSYIIILITLSYVYHSMHKMMSIKSSPKQ